jgi:hypothetical protein
MLTIAVRTGIPPGIPVPPGAFAAHPAREPPGRFDTGGEYVAAEEAADAARKTAGNHPSRLP